MNNLANNFVFAEGYGFAGCEKAFFQAAKKHSLLQEVSGHDRGTLWVACRECNKMNVGL
jgi:hypothetical protein